MLTPRTHNISQVFFIDLLIELLQLFSEIIGHLVDKLVVLCLEQLVDARVSLVLTAEHYLKLMEFVDFTATLSSRA